MIEAQFERNLGFFTEDEQMMLGEATISVAGAGGDGGMLAVQLARMGVGAMGGEIRLADPDTFEIENINRQACCTTETVGVNKAVAVADYIRAISPSTRLVTYTEGVQPENVEKFVAGSNLLIDESEFSIHGIGVALARAARKEGIPNMHVMNVGFGAQVTCYDPSSKHTLERRLGLSDDMPIEEVNKKEVDVSRWLAGLPTYGDLSVFEKVVSGEKSAPSVAPGVAMAASIGATQAALHLLKGQNNRPAPVYAPRALTMDAMTGESHTVRLPYVRTLLTGLRMTLRSKLGLNPRTSY